MSPNAGGSSNLMSVDQAAASLGLSKDVLLDLAKKQIVRAVSDGKTMMFKTSEVEAFREANTPGDDDDLDALHLGVDWEKEFDGQEFSIE